MPEMAQNITGKDGNIYLRSSNNKHQAGSVSRTAIQGPATTYGVTVAGVDNRHYNFHVPTPRKVAELLRDSDYLNYEIYEEPAGEEPRLLDPFEAHLLVDEARRDLPENKPLDPHHTVEYGVRLRFRDPKSGTESEYAFHAGNIAGVEKILEGSDNPIFIEIVETHTGTIDGEDGLHKRTTTWSNRDAVELAKKVWGEIENCYYCGRNHRPQAQCAAEARHKEDARILDEDHECSHGHSHCWSHP